MIFGKNTNNPKFYVYDSLDQNIVDVIQMQRVVTHVQTPSEEIIDKKSPFTRKKQREYLGAYFNASMIVFNRDIYTDLGDFRYQQVNPDYESDLSRALRLYAYCKAGNIIRFVPASDLETYISEDNQVQPYYRVFVEPKNPRILNTSKSYQIDFDIVGYELLASAYPFDTWQFGGTRNDSQGSSYTTVSTFSLGIAFSVEWWHLSKGDALGGADTIFYNSDNGGAYAQSNNTSVMLVEKTTGSSYVSKAHNGRQMGRWEHFAINRNGAAVECFQNGASLGTGTLGDGSAENKISTLWHSDVHGSMRFIRIYRRSMTAAEVKAQWNNGNGAPPLKIPMIAGWDFKQVTSVTEPDISGNGHTATWIVNPSTRLLKAGPITKEYCIDLDGNSQYAYLGANFNLGKTYTIEFWTKAPVSGSSANNRWAIVGTTGGTSSIGFNSTSIAHAVVGASPQYWVHGNPDPTVWTQWILRRQSGSVNVWKNGAQIASPQALSADNDFYVLQLFNSASQYAIGAWARFRLYTEYIDDLGIARMWNNGEGAHPFANILAACWNFDKAYPSATEPDLSGNGRTLTVANNPKRRLWDF